MEENVALDSNKQKQFMKSLKGLKKLMKKSGPKTEKPEQTHAERTEVQQEQKRKAEKIPQEKATKKKRKPRGLVYLSHIPHGFYEHEMSQYFKQFGVVTNVRVIRSKRTGRSKGHAFVEFKNTDVAQVVAETMNNYLMGKRLIKAVYIPPKDQRRNARRKNWNDQHNPGSEKKLLMKKGYNSNKSENDDVKIAKKLLSNLSNTKGKLKELNIDYDFFTPVDVPEALSDTVVVKEENDEDIKIETDKKVKQKRKRTVSDVNNDNTNSSIGITTEVQPKEGESKKSKKKNKKQKKKSDDANDNAAPNKESITNTTEKKQTGKNVNKKNKVATVLNPVIAEGQKQQKTKVAVKPPEDFIKLGDDENEDSDSSYHFDSDQFDTMLNSDDSASSGSEDTSIMKNVDNKKSKVLLPKKKTGDSKVATQKVQVNRQNNRQQQQNKRKGPEKAASQSKKTKFEKQSKKKLPNKQIIKRKK